MSRELMDIMPVLIFYVVFWGILILITIANYLFRGFGLYGIAKKQKASYPWLAFIPIAATYLQGELAGPLKIGNKTMKNPGLWTLLVPILYSIVSVIICVVFMVSLIAQTVAMQVRSWYAEPAFPVFSFVLFMIAIVVVALIGSALISLLYGLVNYHIHKKYRTENMALFHMLLGLVVPLYQSIFFFLLRNQDPIDSQPVSEPPVLEQPASEE